MSWAVKEQHESDVMRYLLREILTHLCTATVCETRLIRYINLETEEWIPALVTGVSWATRHRPPLSHTKQHTTVTAWEDIHVRLVLLLKQDTLPRESVLHKILRLYVFYSLVLFQNLPVELYSVQWIRGIMSHRNNNNHLQLKFIFKLIKTFFLNWLIFIIWFYLYY